mgnify:CR=1 FL=1
MSTSTPEHDPTGLKCLQNNFHNWQADNWCDTLDEIMEVFMSCKVCGVEYNTDDPHALAEHMDEVRANHNWCRDCEGNTCDCSRAHLCSRCQSVTEPEDFVEGKDYCDICEDEEE